MDSAFLEVSRHGYGVLCLAVFLESIGFPIPAALALVIAGAASARGSLALGIAFGASLLTMAFADGLMFLLGRYTGWWLLGLLCRLSLNPESCILRSAGSFHRRGRTLLLVAKFVPGINTMAPPLAGSMNMRPLQFFALDVAGGALYTGAYLILGFLFSDALAAITRTYQAFTRVFTGVVIAALAAYLGFKLWAWFKARYARPIPMAEPAEAARALAAG